MQLLTAEIFVLIITTVDSIQNYRPGSELNPLGPNVCMKTEAYKERTQIIKRRPIHIKSWCWNPLRAFRCETFKWEEYIDFEDIPRSRIVHECCYGYIKKGTRCVPFCFPECLHGICVDPNYCACFPGFYGPTCRERCPEERWGGNCLNECNCSNRERCDVSSGCVCLPGWQGERCEFPCEDGYYGYKCLFECKCDSHTCNHITGECIIQPATTTTEILPPTRTTMETSSSTDTMQIPLKSTTYSAIEISTEIHQSTEEGATTTEISLTEIQTDTDSDSMTRSSTTAESITALLEVVEFESETAKKMISTELPVNMKQRDILVAQITTVKMKDSEKGIKSHLVKNENDVRGSFDRANNAETETKNSMILPGTLDELNISQNNTNWKDLTINKEYTDNIENETEELIYKGGEKPHNQTILKWFNFLPTLSVLSAVSFLIIIIAARWLVLNNRNKTKMVVVITDKGKTFQFQEQIKYQPESIFWENNSTINPVCESDVDFHNTTPILQTFRPLDKGENSTGRKIV